MICIEELKLFLFDLDGTLYLGDRLFPFTKELLQTIRAQGKQYLFMTNNSSKSAEDYVRKFARLGVAADEGDFVTSAQATRHYLLAHLPQAHIYVCGTRSLLGEFAAAGLDVTDTEDDRVSAVVIGYDTELTYRKLETLSRLLRRDIPYIATHPDLVCPTEYGSVPDCGAFCEMLCHATGRLPLVIGKPEPLMAELAMARFGVTPGQTLVTGDRLNTDIACGMRAGTQTLLVFSGETTREGWQKAAQKPSEAWEDCGLLLRKLKAL